MSRSEIQMSTTVAAAAVLAQWLLGHFLYEGHVCANGVLTTLAQGPYVPLTGTVRSGHGSGVCGRCSPVWPLAEQPLGAPSQSV